jgi:hypothetical protein
MSVCRQLVAPLVHTTCKTRRGSSIGSSHSHVCCIMLNHKHRTDSAAHGMLLYGRKALKGTSTTQHSSHAVSQSQPTAPTWPSCRPVVALTKP